MDSKYKIKQGKISVSDGSKTGTVIVTPGVSGVLRIFAVNVSVTVASSGGAGVISLTDGGVAFWTASAAATGVYNIYYGDPGYALTQGNGLAVAVSGGTTDATAIVSGIAVAPGA